MTKERILEPAAPKATDPISDRHRAWGAPCLATDIDLILLEYSRGDGGKVCALVDYKLGIDRKLSDGEAHATMKIGELGEQAGIPAYAVKYNDDPWRFRVYPLNTFGSGALPFARGELITERRFVTFLYLLRGIQPSKDLAATLCDHLERRAA